MKRAPLMSHEDRVKLIRKPFPMVRIQPRAWAGTILNEPIPTKRSVYLDDECYADNVRRTMENGR